MTQHLGSLIAVELKFTGFPGAAVLLMLLNSELHLSR